MKLDTLLRPIRNTHAWQVLSVRAEPHPDRWRGDVDDIASYHRARPRAAGAELLPDHVWTDLELGDVFQSIDSCVSAPGQQVLYDMMRTPLQDAAAVAARDAAVRAMSADADARAAVQGALQGLSGSAAYDLHRLVHDELPSKPRWSWLLPLLPLSAVTGVVLLLVDPLAGLLVLLVTIACNIAVQLGYRPRVLHLMRPVTALPALLRSARRLAPIHAPALEPQARAASLAAEKLHVARWLTLHLGREQAASEMVSAVAGYANLVFLADVNSFVYSLDMLRANRAVLADALHAIGTADALCAIAKYREQLPAWCTPDFTGDASPLSAEAIYHPLVDAAVPNDLRVQGASLLITGSNMGGKTTYLRAAGACVVLGRTIATCPAQWWSGPLYRVDTLIDREDDLSTGRSYFLVEAEHVRQMLESAASGRRHMYIVDELFRGTNTRERVAAARAVLDELNRAGHACLVSTHDLDLIELLQSDWEFWHFQESFDGVRMYFDYRMRPGSARAGNALKLLEHAGYPERVMRAAYDTFAATAQA